MQCPIYNCPCQYVHNGCPKIAYEMKLHYQPENEQQTNIKTNDDISAKKKIFTTKEAYEIGKKLGIKWDKSNFDVEQYRMGLDVELEHGRRDINTNVTSDNPLLTGKIALAHLNEFPDYYTRLAKLESEAKSYWGKSK